MVLIQRIASLEQFIWAGHLVSVNYSYADNTFRLKAKVFVGAEANTVPWAHRELLLAILQPLYALTSFCITVDRGHTFSAGHSQACFWMKPPGDIPKEAAPAEVETVLDYLTATPSATVVSGHGTRPVKMVSFSEKIETFPVPCQSNLPKKPTEPRPPTARPNRSRKRVTLTTEDEFISHLEQMIVELASPVLDACCDSLEQYPGGLSERTTVEAAIVWQAQKTLQPYRKKLLKDFDRPGCAALVTRTWDNLQAVLAPLAHKKAGERWYCTGRARNLQATFREDVREDA